MRRRFEGPVCQDDVEDVKPKRPKKKFKDEDSAWHLCFAMKGYFLS